MNPKGIKIGLVVAIVIAIGGYFFPHVQLAGLGYVGTRFPNGVSVGTSTNPSIAGAFQVGTNGTPLVNMRMGTCYVQAYAATIAASTTARVDCQGTAAVGGLTTATSTPISGIQFGDNVQITLSTTTTGSTSNGLILASASASTTAGYITLSVSNLTGTTFTWPTSGVASGTASYITSR